MSATNNQYRRSLAARVMVPTVILSFVACATNGPIFAPSPTIADAGHSGVILQSEAGQPGAGHKRLEVFIGNWKAVTQIWHFPGDPPATQKGTISNFWMLDGRFVGQEYKSRGIEPQFQGLGAIGFDNVTKKYTVVWLDSMSTSMVTEQGECDDTGREFTFHGTHSDADTGTLVATKTVVRFIDTDHYVHEAFRVDANGASSKTLQVMYARK